MIVDNGRKQDGGGVRWVFGGVRREGGGRGESVVYAGLKLKWNNKSTTSKTTLKLANPHLLKIWSPWPGVSQITREPTDLQPGNVFPSLFIFTCHRAFLLLNLYSFWVFSHHCSQCLALCKVILGHRNPFHEAPYKHLLCCRYFLRHFKTLWWELQPDRWCVKLLDIGVSTYVWPYSVHSQ